MTEVTDRDVICMLADVFGTLKKQTRKYAYIGEKRFTFDDKGNVTQIAEPAPGPYHWRNIGAE